VINLLSNSVKFTPESGRIAVRTANDEQGELEIEISDNGVGIEAEMLPKLFTPFEQGERSVTRKFGGLGLGLAISKGLVELQRGAISAMGDGKDKGATFKLRFESLKTPAEAVASSQPDPAAKRKNLRILLVEDHPDTCRVMSKLLRSFGYSVDCADSVKSALELGDSKTFDLLISDIGLPDGSGLEIMQLFKNKSIKGIALSGFGLDEDLHRSQEAGFAEHLIKPVNFHKLDAVIQRVAA
jgi:CheY-like chemotaxis protein